MRGVLLAVVVALCAVLAPAVTPVAVGAPPPKSSAPKEEAPREERETSRPRVPAAAVERESGVARPSVVTLVVPRPAAGAVQVPEAEPIAVWRTPPALQVFRN